MSLVMVFLLLLGHSALCPCCHVLIAVAPVRSCNRDDPPLSPAADPLGGHPSLASRSLVICLTQIVHAGLLSLRSTSLPVPCGCAYPRARSRCDTAAAR